MLQGERHKPGMQIKNADVVSVPGAAVTSAQALAKSLHHFAPQI